MMLMTVPLMIWSARTLMHSQAWSIETAMPARTAATTPTSRAGVAPKTAPGTASGIASSTTTAAMNPTNAAVSIIPSMPMFTMPLRSFMTPHSAPRAMGVASCSVWGARLVVTIASIEVGDELEDEAEDRQMPNRKSIRPSPRRSYGSPCRAHRASTRSARHRGTARRMTTFGGEEQQDQALDDVDDLDRDLGRDLHRRRAGAHAAEQQGGEQDADRMGAAQQGHGDAGEADGRAEDRPGSSRGVRISIAPASPANRPHRLIVRMISVAGSCPAYRAALGFAPTVRISKPRVVR